MNHVIDNHSPSWKNNVWRDLWGLECQNPEIRYLFTFQVRRSCILDLQSSILRTLLSPQMINRSSPSNLNSIINSPLWIWKGVSATSKSSRYTLSYLRSLWIWKGASATFWRGRYTLSSPSGWYYYWSCLSHEWHKWPLGERLKKLRKSSHLLTWLRLCTALLLSLIYHTVNVLTASYALLSFSRHPRRPSAARLPSMYSPLRSSTVSLAFV